MKWIKKVDNWSNNIQSLWLPRHCLLCGAKAHDELDLCQACYRELPFNHHACTRCAIPLASGTDGICGQCQQHPPSFHSAHALFRYQPPLDHLLITLKFRHKLHMARLLAELMARHIADTIDDRPETIIPVPLHPSRLRQRGFNQALELSRPIAARLNIPLATNLCQRVRATPNQTQLPANMRRSNVRGAFEINTQKLPGHVAIIDDVMTTGSTVEELAYSLTRAGVKRVEVWTLARAVIRP